MDETGELQLGMNLVEGKPNVSTCLTKSTVSLKVLVAPPEYTAREISPGNHILW